MQNTTEKHVAVFIDADNAQYNKLDSIFEKANTYGRVVVKRAYGNWTKETLKNWSDCLKKYAIKQIQQADYVTGKNTTDIALIIDAVDFVNRENYDVFVLVSSDSDFTPLAIYLRERGKEVIGIGDKSKVVEAFRNACDVFVNISDTVKKKETSKADKKTETSKPDKKTKKEKDLNRLLKIAAETWQNDEGFTNVGAAGSYIRRANPEFNMHDYGVSKLSDYIEKQDEFVIRKRGTIIEYKLK